MSWDVRWMLPGHRSPARRASFEAAVHEAVARDGFEVKLDGDRAHVRLSREFVVRHDLKIEPLPDDASFWGTLELHEYELHPPADDGPYETLWMPLEDANGDGAGWITSVCRTDERILAASSGQHTFESSAGQWRELDWPEDYDDGLPRCVGHDGKTAWAAGDRFFAVRGALVPLDDPPEQSVRLIGGVDGRTVAIGDEGLVQVRVGDRWTTIDRDSLGTVLGLAAGPSGIYVSAACALLARVEADRVTPIEAPDAIRDVMWETPALAIASDGAVWLAQRGSAARYDGHGWTTTSCEIDRPIALLSIGDELVILGEDARGATWDGAAWQPFRFAADRRLLCACVGPDREIVIGSEDGVYTLERRGLICELSIASNTSANREAWGAICEIGQRVASALGAGPAR